MNPIFIPSNSVLNSSNTQTPGDFSSPYTLIEWLENTKISSTDSSSYFQGYIQYINEWFDYNKFSTQDRVFYRRQTYINLLKEIAIKYTTYDEKRFLSNLNFNDNVFLDVAIPFFTKKIKKICVYYTQNRDKLKNSVLKTNLKGSNYGVETLIKKAIVEVLQLNEFETLNVNLPPLSSIIDDFHIQIREKFDTQQYYFDIKPDSSSELYNVTDSDRKKYFNLDATFVNEASIYDLEVAILDAIRAYPLFLQQLGTTNFSINYVLSGINYSYLTFRDFKNYETTENFLDLNVDNYKKYYENYMGSDLFILSGDANLGTLSAKVLESKTPYRNLLNRRYPTVAHIPEKTYTQEEKYLGKFFTGNNLGILYWNTFKKIFLINQSLSSSKIYVIPDPDIGFDAIGTSLSYQGISGLDYLRDVQWNRYDWSNDFSFGKIYSNPKIQKFYPYYSKTEHDFDADDGISRISDYQDFWDERLFWKNKDIFNFANDDFYPLQEREKYLLYNRGFLTKYKTDIFGNHYGFFKNNLVKSYSPGIVSGYPIETLLNKTTITPLSSLYDIKNTQFGSIYIRYFDDTTIEPLSSALSAVFVKYPFYVKTELQNSVINFDIIYNTIIIETPKFLIFDKLNFDFDTKQFETKYNKPTYFEKYKNSYDLENSSNFWYDSESNKLIVSFLNLFSSTSGTNKILYPKIYEADINDLQFKKMYPDIETVDALSSFTIDLGSQQFIPSFCDKSLLNYDHESQVLSHLVKCYDNNGLSVLLNYKFLKTFSYYTLSNAILYKPLGFLFDLNYEGKTFYDTVQYSGSFTGLIGGQPEFLTFLCSNSSLSGYNYYYVSEVSLTIDPGVSAFIYCDNTLSNTFDIFVNSVNMNLRDVYGTLVYDFSGSNEHSFTTINETITANLGGYNYTITYMTSAQHVLKLIPT